MRPYRAILSARFRTLLQYRAAAVAGLGTQLFFGYVLVKGYQAFYAATDAPQPISISQIITYVWLGQAMLGLLPWIADPDVRRAVREGSVAYDMLRPVHVYWLWYSRALARRTAPTLLRAVPMFVIAGLFLGLQGPASWASGAAWLAATVGAVLLASAIATILGITLLWTVSGQGVNQLVPAMVMLFSGFLVPIPLFPKWAQTVLYTLPFRGIIDIPFRLYLGHIPPGDAFPMLLHQWTWILVLVLIGQWALGRGLRRLVVQGG